MTSYVQLIELAHSLQNRFRQVKFPQVLIYLSDIITASQRLLATLERIWGTVAKKILLPDPLVQKSLLRYPEGSTAAV